MTPSTTKPSGRCSFAQRLLRRAPLMALACMTLSSCVPLEQLSFDASQPEMVAFGSCNELQQFLRNQAYTKALFMQGAQRQGMVYNPLGYSSLTSGIGSVDTNTGEPVVIDEPRANVPFSETNNQEEGVDEADIFKVDATHAFALHGQKLVIIEALGTPREPTPGSPGGGILQIDGAVEVASIDIEGSPIEMFLIDNRVVVITRTNHGTLKGTLGEKAPSRPDSTLVVKAIVVDVTDRKNPVKEREVAFEGNYLSSRRIGNQVYVVARGMLEGPRFSSPLSTEATWLIERQLALSNASLDSWIPYTYNTNLRNGETTVASANCQSTYASRATNGDDALGVYSFDVSRPDSELKSTTILGDGAVVYASTESILVALTNFTQMQYGGTEPPSSSPTGPSLFDGLGIDLGWGTPSSTPSSAADTTRPDRELTFIHRFELGDEGTVRYHATGTVEGWILNQFSLSEYRGYVRVATVVDPEGFATDSRVTVLQARDKGGLLQAPQGAQPQFLDVVGMVDGIGRNQDLYATRFVGDRGYLVTFRQTDPLWIVDLKDPTRPELRGRLEVPGYSTYLHPVGENHLLAVGRGQFGFGEPSGVKLSIFDVSNPSSPRAVDERNYDGDSEALTEHHAFRYIEDLNTLMLPMTGSGSARMQTWSVDLSRGYTERGAIRHDSVATNDRARQVRRAYRIGDYVYTYSSGGVVISRLADLEPVATVDLPDL